MEGVYSMFNVSPIGHPANPDYRLFVKRLKSFDTWPPALPVEPQEIAKAGFFYTGAPLGSISACYFSFL
jgi:hypothetical protein